MREKNKPKGKEVGKVERFKVRRIHFTGIMEDFAKTLNKEKLCMDKIEKAIRCFSMIKKKK